MLDPVVKPSVENLRSEIKRVMERNHRWLAEAKDQSQSQSQSKNSPFLFAVPDVAASCEMILADQLLHTLSPELRQGIINFIRSQQLPEGSWPDAHGKPSLSLTAFGTWALRCFADPQDQAAIARGQRCVLEMGGAQRGSFSLRLWLALSGAIPWSWLTAVPAHLWLVPEGWPLSTGTLTLRTRTLLCAYHLLSSVQARLQLGEVQDLLARSADGTAIPPRITRAGLTGDLLQAIDRSIKFSHKRPRGALLRQSTRRALSLAEDLQDAHGAWVSTHPTIFMCLALRAQGQHSDAPALQRALDYLHRSRGRLAQPASGPEQWVQGLSLAPNALRYRLEHALDFSQAIGCKIGEQDPQAMLDEELRWEGPRHGEIPPGGWPSQPGALMHHDLWASCQALLRLSDHLEHSQIRGQVHSQPAHNNNTEEHPVNYDKQAKIWGARRRAGQVLLAMQNFDGTFARFSRSEQHNNWSRLPWVDAQGMQIHRDGDPFQASLSAQALLCLSQLGWRNTDDRIERGLLALEQLQQRHATQWPLRTLAQVSTTATELLPEHAPFRKAAEHQLRQRQLENGSFGDTTATAHALGALWSISQRQKKGLCPQGQRALQRILDTMRRPGAPQTTAVPSTGPGLSVPAADPLEAATTLQIVLGRIWLSMS